VPEVRFGRELAATLAVLVAVGLLVRTPAGRLVLPVLSIVVVAAVVVLLSRPAAYPRRAVGVRSRVLDGDAPADATCVVCDAPATTSRRYVREGVVLGVPLVLLDDGSNAYCDDCLE
jgi:hypothetical protein